MADYSLGGNDRAGYKHKMRCRDCGYVWEKVTKTIRIPTQKCPRCRNVHESTVEKQLDLSSGRGFNIGGSNIARAMDATQEMVAQEHGVSNMGDSMKAGDVNSPKLAPHLQAQADNFFGGSMLKKQGVNTGLIARAALSGAYANGSESKVIAQTQRMCDHKFDHGGQGLTHMAVIPKE